LARSRAVSPPSDSGGRCPSSNEGSRPGSRTPTGSRGRLEEKAHAPMMPYRPTPAQHPRRHRHSLRLDHICSPPRTRFAAYDEVQEEDRMDRTIAARSRGAENVEVRSRMQVRVARDERRRRGPLR
jgi:hypothetical protein